jgi:hypothetical protein
MDDAELDRIRAETEALADEIDDGWSSDKILAGAVVSIRSLLAEVKRLRAERDAVIGLIVREGDAVDRWLDKGLWLDHTGYCCHPDRDSAVAAVRRAAELEEEAPR